MLYEIGPKGPTFEPTQTISVTATEVPDFPAGRFYSYDVGRFDVPFGLYGLGVTWDASADQFFFVCAEQDTPTPFTEVYFIDDRAENWGSASTSSDPIFVDHRATLVRAVEDRTTSIEIPTLGKSALAVLVLLLAAVGWLLSTRR